MDEPSLRPVTHWLFGFGSIVNEASRRSTLLAVNTQHEPVPAAWVELSASAGYVREWNFRAYAAPLLPVLYAAAACIEDVCAFLSSPVLSSPLQSSPALSCPLLSSLVLTLLQVLCARHASALAALQASPRSVSARTRHARQPSAGCSSRHRARSLASTHARLATGACACAPRTCACWTATERQAPHSQRRALITAPSTGPSTTSGRMFRSRLTLRARTTQSARRTSTCA